MRERDPSLLICLRSIILATEYLNTPHRLQPNRHPLRAGPGRRSVLTLSAASAAGPSPCDARLPPRRGNSSRARGIALDRVRDHPRPLPQPSPHPPRLPPNPLRFPSGSWHASQRVTDGLLRIVSPHVRSIQRALSSPAFSPGLEKEPAVPPHSPRRTARLSLPFRRGGESSSRGGLPANAVGHHNPRIAGAGASRRDAAAHRMPATLPPPVLPLPRQ